MTIVETMQHVRSIPVVIPHDLPVSHRKLDKLLRRASTRVTNDMTVGEYKKILAAQDELTTIMATSLVIYMNEVYGVSMPDRIPNWHSYTILGTGTWNRGEFSVTETRHAERGPSIKTGEWIVPKAALIKELRRPADRRFRDIAKP